MYYQNCLYLFGYSWPSYSANANDNSIYQYNLTLNYWTIIEGKNANLSKRTYHHGVVYNNCMFVFYGLKLESAEPVLDMWKFNFITSEWSFVWNFTDQADILASMKIAFVIIDSLFYSLFGRTNNSIINSVYTIDFSSENPSVIILTNNQNSPVQRKNHCSIIINDLMFVIGGVSNSGTYLNDVWRFFLLNSTWSNDVYTGSIPSGRELFACTSSSNIIMIFGGRGSGNIATDICGYDISLKFWICFEIANSISSRYNLCMVQFDFYSLIIGGTNDLVIFDEIWLFNEMSMTFSLINSNDKIKFNLIDFKCWLDNENNAVNIYVIGGRNGNYKPDNNIYKIQVLAMNDSFITNTSIIYTSNNNIPSESAIIVDRNLVYVLFGSIWNGIMFPTIFAINYITKIEYKLNTTPEIMLFGHSAIFFKDSIYIFCGGLSAGSIKLTHATSNKLYKLNTNAYDPVNLTCSPGTISPNCTPCPAGSYFNISYCIPCPKGTSSQTIASTNSRYCIPCDYGYYSNEIGVTYCKMCPAHSYCPIGSRIPEPPLVKLSFNSIQPQAYAGQTTYVSTLVSQLWYALIASTLFLFILIFSIKVLWENIFKFDIFSNQHSQSLGEAVIYRKTKIGGIFSVFSVLGVSVIIISGFLSFQLDNITEIKSLVPIIIIDNPISASKLFVTVIFYWYGASCNNSDTTCMNINSFIDLGFNYTNKTITCQMINTNCIITIEYSEISLETSSKISMQMGEITAAASSISVSINCSSSIPSEYSSIFIPIYPDTENQVFVGNSPTIINFDFTSSVIFYLGIYLTV